MMKKVESQKKLNRFLEKRPGRAELQKTEILSNNTVADSLAGSAKTLERKITKDKISKFMKSKPEADMNKAGNRMSASLQGTAKTLEFKIKENNVNNLLKKRPDKEELERANVLQGSQTAASLQGTANTLARKMKENTLKKRLSQRPNREELEKANIIGDEFTANSLHGTASTLAKKMKQNTLKKRLSQRPSKEELTKANIITDGKTANSLQGTASSLESKMKQNTLKRQLSRRPERDSLKKSNILNNTKAASSLQGTANTLATKMKQNNLKKRISMRPDKEELRKANILQDNTANSLQGTANVLAKKMKQATLRKQLSIRPDKKDLQKTQILKEFNNDLAPSLQANALILEKNLNKDKISLFLKNGDKVIQISVDKKLKTFLENRPTKEELEKQQILESDSTAPSLQPRAKLLEIQFKQNTLKKKLSMRSSRKSLEEKMILREVDEENVPTEDSQNPRGAHKMSVFFGNGDLIGEVLVPEALRELLTARPSKEELAKANILANSKTANSLQGTANVLEKKMKQATLRKQLSIRPGREELEKSNIIGDSKTANSLHGTANVLEKKMKQATLRKQLSIRPDKKDLQKTQILKEFNNDLAPSLQANALILEKNLNKDKISLFLKNGDKVIQISVDRKLKTFLENRPTKEELEKQQILESDSTAPSLQPRAKLLEIQFKQNTLKKKLSMRSSRKSLEEKMILREVDEENVPTEGSQNPRGAHKMSVFFGNGDLIGEVLVPEALRELLSARPSKEELAKANILANSKAANSLQGTANVLEKKMKQATLRKQLSIRPGREELEKSNIIGDSKTANSLQGTANVLEKKMKQATLRKQLSIRPDKKDLQKTQILKEFNNDLAPSLQANALILEKNLNKDKISLFLKNGDKVIQISVDKKLKTFLENRPTKEELEKQQILESDSTAPSLQPRAKLLEIQFKQNTLKKKLSMRSSRKSLEEKMILREVDEGNMPTEGSPNPRGGHKMSVFFGNGDLIGEVLVPEALRELLSARPSKEELTKANILANSKTANSLQGTANVLEKKMKQATLKKQLSIRPDKKDLQKTQILKEFKTDLAPSLQANALILEKNLNKDKINLFFKNGDKVFEVSVDKKLKKFLENRPSKEELEKQQILESDTTAPLLQPRAKLLEIQFKQNTLKKKLSLRSSRKSLEQKMILREIEDEPLPPKPQNSVEELPRPVHKMSVFFANGELIGEVIIPAALNDLLSSRPSKEELTSKEILPSRKAADSLQGTANVLEKQIRQDKIKKNLSKRPDTGTLKKNAVLKTFETDLAPGLQGNATSLEAKLAKDKMSLAMRNGERIGEETNEKKGLEFI